MPSKAELLPTHTPELLSAAVQKAAAVLRSGGLVALPTETVYGLAANALDPRAVSAIFEVKGRPAHNPIIVHVSDVEMARSCVATWPPLAERLAAAFWPGPLTLVLPRSPKIPDIVTAGGETVGVRCPAHPVMQAVLRACRFPLAAPSANPSNRISATTANHVVRHLGGRLPLVLDGGPSQVGIESTVLDISGPVPRVLRPGVIHASALLPIVGRLAEATDSKDRQLRSPGLLPKHYSPRARLVVCDWENESGLLLKAKSFGVALDRIAVVSHTMIPAAHEFCRVSALPRDAGAYARALYAELHAGDDSGAEVILLERPPEGPEWQAVSDRLRRAQG